MSVTTSDVLAPAGPIDPALLFPGKSRPDVVADINAWIAKGEQSAAKFPEATPEQKDDFVRAYVVYRGYDAVVDRLANMPASFTAADEGSVSFNSAQLRAMERKRDAALDDYNTLASTLGSLGNTSGPTSPPSCTIPVRFV